ncbi:putative membrane protein YgcG [Nocardioides sp. BE266]|uniref:hypothetical protein n=1 Tax=Nocardioides sp. BE266 TaxID=2817725 RepID=UPI00285F5548|nr:hypothetical protein [Nocardioides sp. BE266]MDR7253189.1 putative membrane protein YgcG [Nocardioides sp. BE266]
MTTRASRALAAHPRQSWLTFGGIAATGLAAAVSVALLQGAGRVGVVMTAFTGVVVIGVLTAVLDAIVSPGNPDFRGSGHLGHGYGGDALGGGVGFHGAGGDCGGGGGVDCG